MIESLMMKNNVGGGSDVLLAGTMDHGWFGEVSADDFISYPSLMSVSGIRPSYVLGINDGWLKFALSNKIIYIAKKPIGSLISYNDLNSKGAIVGTKTLVIDGSTYKLRVPRARASGLPFSGANGDDPQASHGSEWNRLLYHVVGKPFSWAATSLASEGITEGDWASILDTDLYTTPSGIGTICQESDGNNCNYRGILGISRFSYLPVTDRANSVGWRPVLELVE